MVPTANTRCNQLDSPISNSFGFFHSQQGKFLYTKFFAVGLFRLVELTGGLAAAGGVAVGCLACAAAGSVAAVWLACWLAWGCILRLHLGLYSPHGVAHRRAHSAALRLLACPAAAPVWQRERSASAARAEARAAVLTVLMFAPAPAGSKDPKSLAGLVKALNLSQVGGV